MEENSHWHKDWFEEAYATVYAHRDPDEAQRALLSLAKHASLRPDAKGDRVLDLGCGAGRYSIQLASMGFHVLALDYSMFLLRQAQASTKLPSSQAPTWLRGNFHQLPLRGGFDWVLSLFTSFGYCERDTDNEAQLSAMADLLAPGGRLLIDYLNPQALRKGLVPRSQRHNGGTTVEETRCIREDLNMVEKQIRYFPTEGRNPKNTGHGVERVKLYEPDWFVTRLPQLRLQLHLGDLEGSPWSPESARSILVFSREAQC